MTGNRAAARQLSPGTPVSIRDLSDSDLTAVQCIYAHHVLHGLATFEEVPPTIEELGKRWLAIASCGLPYLVADIGGEVIGYAYASPYRPRSAYRCTIEDSVYVAPGMTGCGVGSGLLQALIARCESGPWRQMLAVIGDSGNAASIALHRRLGFASVGIFTAVGFKLGSWVDTVLMQRSLGMGATRSPL